MDDDISVFDRLAPLRDVLCARCGAFLHAYAVTCFGCEQERGSMYFDRLDGWELLQRLPIARLLESPWLREFADETSLLTSGHSEADQRRLLWLGAELGTALDEPEWAVAGSPLDKFNYLGGLESQPHSEYGQMHYAAGVITLVGDHSRAPIAQIQLDRLLGLSAHPSVEELLGGRTFGFIGDNFAVFQSQAPIKANSGVLKFVYADDAGIWRVAAIGCRTGWTDPIWTFAFAASAAELIGLYTTYWTAQTEADIGVAQHAQSLGFRIDRPVLSVEGRAPAAASLSVSDSLRQLQELLDAGLISSDDYERKKSEILNRL